MELLGYPERTDVRFLQHSKDMNDDLLQREPDTSALLGLMVTVRLNPILAILR